MKGRILFSVLNWGLGHATRSIPIINTLLEGDYEVVLASDGLPLSMLRDEFPSLSAYELPGYNVIYKSENLLINVTHNANKIFQAVSQEKKEVVNIVEKEGISALITDNRYGSHHPVLPGVIITHQLKFRTDNALVNRMSAKIARRWITPFDRIWIPDTYQRTLSGELSIMDDERVRYIGPQTTLKPITTYSPSKYRVAAVLSGPEPQRTNLERAITPQLINLGQPAALIRGVHAGELHVGADHVDVFNFMNREEINDLFNKADIIIGRSGYSSIMDFYGAGKKAVLIPTPGQPEQEYLGRYLSTSNQFTVQWQDNINIRRGIEELENSPAVLPPALCTTLLRDAINDFSGLIEESPNITALA